MSVTSGTNLSKINVGTGQEQVQIIHPQCQLITTKLTEINYLVWKHQILAAIRGYGLEEYLTGGCKVPEQFLEGTSKEPVLNPEFTNWRKQDQLVASWLLSSLSENILVNTVGLTSSQEIWESLEISFSQESAARVLEYKYHLNNLKKGSMSMREYLSKIKQYCDLLKSAGQTISDQEQVMTILAGLGNEYNPVMVGISCRIPACSLREAQALLTAFESRLEGVGCSGINTEGSIPSVNFISQAQTRRGEGFYGNINRGRGGRLFNSFRGRGYYRGSPNFRGRGGRFSNYKPRCQVCKMTNHTADVCHYRFEQ
ncbi:hypothetical protein DH2020_033045 [Rehmannia glutinosa]|uniref:Retrotransposon Copia-like N-terminal domain-containing protein n=1 Tax=Rehmannia glutinosa TaxID=99300 RepID=A0ABR0VDE9_REHGL